MYTGALHRVPFLCYKDGICTIVQLESWGGNVRFLWDGNPQLFFLLDAGVGVLH